MKLSIISIFVTIVAVVALDRDDSQVLDMTKMNDMGNPVYQGLDLSIGNNRRLGKMTQDKKRFERKNKNKRSSKKDNKKSVGKKKDNKKSVGKKKSFDRKKDNKKSSGKNKSDKKKDNKKSSGKNKKNSHSKDFPEGEDSSSEEYSYPYDFDT